MVDEGYSFECTRIFGRDALDLPLPELLCPDDMRQRDFVTKGFQLAMGCADGPFRRDACLGLLPSEYPLHERYCQAEYRPLVDGRMRLILTDSTDQKRLRERLDQERLRLLFIVNALENRDDLMELLHDYDQFQSRVLPELLTSSRAPADLLAEVFRLVHTFKGCLPRPVCPGCPANCTSWNPGWLGGGKEPARRRCSGRPGRCGGAAPGVCRRFHHPEHGD